MREFLTYGSVRGVLGNWHSYRDSVNSVVFLQIFCTGRENHRGQVSVQPLKHSI
jgi:hypothetical protein